MAILDLELDTEKNQYESGRIRNPPTSGSAPSTRRCKSWRGWPGGSRSWAQQQRQPQQTSQQRWHQEMLRREAEELQRQMER